MQPDHPSPPGLWQWPAHACEQARHMNTGQDILTAYITPQPAGLVAYSAEFLLLQLEAFVANAWRTKARDEFQL